MEAVSVNFRKVAAIWRGCFRALTLVTILTLLVLSTSSAQGALTTNAPEGMPVFKWDFVTEFADAPPNFRNMTDRNLRLDPDGRARLAFGGDHLYYAWYGVDNNWHIVIVDDTFGVGEYASLALDTIGRPRISYFDHYNNALKFAYCNAGCETPAGWIIQTLDKPTPTSNLRATAEFEPESENAVEGESAKAGASGLKDRIVDKFGAFFSEYSAPNAPDATPGIGMNSSIVVDPNNRIHISYYDSVNRILKYATWNGLDPWEIEVIDRRYDAGVWSSIDVDPYSYLPRVSYMSEQYDDLKYAEIKSGSWKTYTIDSTGNVGAFTSLVIDSWGVPHISYRDRDHGNLKYASMKNDKWFHIVVDNGADVGGYTSIDLKPDGVPCISYFDYTDQTLKYTCEDGTGWKHFTVTTILGDIGPEGYFTSLVVDSTGLAHISYFHTAGHLKYAQEWPAYTWSRSIVNNNPAFFAGDVGMSTSLTLDAANQPHISYFSLFDSEAMDNLKYARKIAGVWIDQVMFDKQASEGLFSSLKLDSAGRLHVAYYSMTNYDLIYAHWDGAQWIIENLDTVDNRDVGMFVSLALYQDRPYISYYDATNGDLRFAYWTGTQWLYETVAYHGDVGLYTSLAFYQPLQSPGIYLPGISYYDETEGNLMYAYKTQLGVWETRKVDQRYDVGMYSSLAYINFDTPVISYYDGTYGDLKFARKRNDQWEWDIFILDSYGDVGQYTSVATDPTGRAHICYYDAIEKDLRYAVFGPADVIEKYIVDNLGDVGAYCSLAWATDGAVHISYYDSYNGALKYAQGRYLTKVFLPLAVK